MVRSSTGKWAPGGDPVCKGLDSEGQNGPGDQEVQAFQLMDENTRVS